MRRLSRLFLALLLSLSAASGQNAPQPQLQPRPGEQAPAPAPTGADRQITIEVQVTDKSGAPVRGLQKQDFTVLDDKQPQNILSFRAVDRGVASTTDPVEIVLVIDAVNTSFQAVARERDEVRKFLLRNGGKLAEPVSLVIFSDAGADVQNGSSRDGNALATLFDQKELGLRTVTRSQGFWGATERLEMSLKAIRSLGEYEGTRPGRKLMIWISPGWPLLSGPNVQLSYKDLQQFFDSIVAFSTGLRQARVTIYSLDPLGMSDFGRSKNYEEFVKGVTSPSRTVPGNLGLQVLAVQTGGRVFTSTNDLTSAIADCAADADAYYVLSFDGALADRANEYHAIGVTVDRPGVKARTRTGYYAQR
jgi:VWFA-related protein